MKLWAGWQPFRAGRRKPQLHSCVVTLTLVSPLIFTRACRQKLKSVEEPLTLIQTDLVFERQADNTFLSELLVQREWLAKSSYPRPGLEGLEVQDKGWAPCQEIILPKWSFTEPLSSIDDAVLVVQDCVWEEPGCPSREIWSWCRVPTASPFNSYWMDVGTTQRGTRAPSISGGALSRVCVPPALAHFVRLIYVGKTNESELRFLNSTVRLKKKHFLLMEHSEQDLFGHIKLEKKFLLNPWKFIYWLLWVLVAVCGCSLVAASRDYPSPRCMGFSFWWALLLLSTSSVAVVHGLSCSWPVESSWTRDQIRVPSIGEWILIHCTTWNVLVVFFHF